MRPSPWRSPDMQRKLNDVLFDNSNDLANAPGGENLLPPLASKSKSNGCVSVSVISVGCLYAVVQIFVEHSVGHATLAPLVEDNPHVIAALL